MDRTAAKDRQAQGGDQGRSRGHDRTAKGLVHAQVDDVGQRGGVVFRLVLEVFADTVIHDDGVVERVAHERHQRRDDVQVDLFAHHRQQPQGDQDVVQKPHDGTEGIIQLELPRNEQGQRQGTDHPVYHVHPEEAHDVHGRTENRRHERGDHPALFEAPGNVHGNQQDGEIHGLKRRIPQIRADLGPHHLQTLDAGRVAGKTLFQRGKDIAADAFAGQVRRGKTDQIIAPVLAVLLDSQTGQFHRGQRFFDIFVGHRLFKLKLDRRAAGKVDAIPQAAIHKNGDQPHQNKKRRQTVGIMPHTYEIYFCLLAEYMKTHARTPRILKLEIHPTTDTHQPGG